MGKRKKLTKAICLSGFWQFLPDFVNQKMDEGMFQPGNVNVFSPIRYPSPCKNQKLLTGRSRSKASKET